MDLVIRGQDVVDRELPDLVLERLIELAEDVALVHLKHRVGDGKMMVLQNRLVVEPDRQLGLVVRLEQVRFARVVHVVHQPRKHERELLYRFQVALDDRVRRQDVASVHYGGPMNEIMKRILSLVIAVPDERNKVAELFKRDLVFLQ